MNAFFFVMPALLCAVYGRRMVQPLARAVMLWGGALFAALMALVMVGDAVCPGDLLDGWGACALSPVEPVLRPATFTYILAGPPLAIAAYALDAWARRRAV